MIIGIIVSPFVLAGCAPPSDPIGDNAIYEMESADRITEWALRDHSVVRIISAIRVLGYYADARKDDEYIGGIVRIHDTLASGWPGLQSVSGEHSSRDLGMRQCYVQIARNAYWSRLARSSFVAIKPRTGGESEYLCAEWAAEAQRVDGKYRR